MLLGCVSSGIVADARTMIDRARLEAQVRQSHFYQEDHILPCIVYITLLAGISGVYNGAVGYFHASHKAAVVFLRDVITDW